MSALQGAELVEPVVAALDVGGTSIKAALINRHGDVRLQVRRPTGVEFGPAAVVDGILSFAHDLVETADLDVVAVGVCVPGTVDADSGIARHAVNLGWRDIPLVRLLGERTGVPVALGHDVRTAVLAEARSGVDPHGSMFFMAIGTGIAG